MTNMILKAKNLVRPKPLDEDLKRRQLILNVLLWFSIFCFSILNIIRIIDVTTKPHDRGLPLIYTLLILAFFIGLRWLSKISRIKIASWLLLIAYSLPMFYSFIHWGADLPAALLLTVLIIILSGILIGDKLVLTTAILINIFLIVLTYLQSNHLIAFNSYWRSDQHDIGDAICYSVLFLVIASVAWLFCKEIKRALDRARKSEAELRQERDSLEIRVIERTQQLHQAETEKISQLYRLAEFGRLSSGIFHDLINPLTAVSLNLEQIRDETASKISDAKSYLGQALLATRKMEGLIASIKKQIQQESNLTEFSVNEEIKQITQILAYKARRAQVQIDFLSSAETKLYGDAVKFGQIVINLLANAIEASTESASGLKNTTIKKITVELALQENKIIITVSDQGAGIAPADLPKIFEPFFSTKKTPLADGGGLGIGLASTKNIVENDFGGTITVASQPGQGSCFVVSLPKK